MIIFKKTQTYFLSVFILFSTLVGFLNGSQAPVNPFLKSENRNKNALVYQSSKDIYYILAGTGCTGVNVKPGEYLQNYSNKPIFRPGHTLPMLSQWGWGISYDASVQLADWNYSFYIGDANSTLVANMANPTTLAGKALALSKSDPDRYRLQVNVDRYIVPFANYPASAWAHDSGGRFIYDSDGSKIFSPEAPVSFLRQVGEQRADYLRQISEKANIAVVLNGGEAGLGVPINVSNASNDPKVKSAQGTKGWPDYISEKKAYQENLTADAVRSALPDRQLYIYYFASGGATRNYGTQNQWFWNYDKMQTVTDLPNESMYYTQFNSGWVGASTMLSQVLNGVGRQIQLGQPLSYNWVNGGWWKDGSNPGGLGELDKYAGFLKTYFTAGNIGGIAGYFSYPTVQKEGYDGFDACFDPTVSFDYSKYTSPQPNSIPHWLTQMMSLSQNQALFSYLEPFLRNGDLLAGNGQNAYSDDQPSYEFSTGFANTRVVARKMKSTNEWIITAWAADGVTRDVSVTIPTLGTVSVNAVSSGHVYYGKLNGGSPSLTLVDTDPLNPTPSAKALWDSNVLPHN